MNRNQFHQYLNYPDQLNADSLVELGDLVKEYPYFQAARMLYVKNLKNEDNILLNRQLKITAACINDRQLLFGLLNNIRIESDGTIRPVIASKELLPEKIESVPEGFFSLEEEPISSSSNNIDEGPIEDKSIYIKELERFIPIADLDLLLIDFPVGDSDILDFDFDDKLPEIKKPIETTALTASLETDIKKEVSTRDLIDNFIKKNPRMAKPVMSSNEADDISLKSLDESDAFMTETLAEIYFKQGYYYRALQAYEKLSLKYPQKSIYFASQIQKIKELITNQ